MAATSYDAWAKFDVDRELERVDERTQQEEQTRAVEQQQRAKLRVEDAVTTNAEQSAQVLAAHAAVAALKAKARAKKEKQVAAAATATTSDRESAVAAQLERHAALFAKKHELIKCIMVNRRDGDAALQRATNATTATAATTTEALQHALSAFEQALAAAQALEAIVPDVLAVEKEQRVLQTTQASSVNEPSLPTAKASAASHDHAHDHTHNHEHGPSCHGAAGTCSHAHKATAAERKPLSSAPLPKPDDLTAILKMFFIDVYAGIGACHLQQKRLAAASEAFKHVLLRDDMHVRAWLERGRAFELMGASLLAMLHYSRATALDAKNESARECFERVNEVLLSDVDDVLDSNAIARSAKTLTQSGTTVLDVLEAIHLVFQEANALRLEGFFQYAIPKYHVVLRCIDACEGMMPGELSEETVAAVQEALRQIETSCRLNIASGFYEMQKCQLKGIEQCESVLSGSSSTSAVVQAASHFRIGQLLRSAHSYERAMTHLITARQILTAYTAHTTPSQHWRELLTTVDKEIDRCAFERSQHDMPYIRALLVDAQATSTNK